MRRPAGRAGRLVLLSLPVLLAGDLVGQAPPARPYEAVVDGGVTTDAAAGFSQNQVCATGTAWSLGARAHRGLNRWFALEAVAQLFIDFSTKQCVSAPLPPPPPTGPFTLRYTTYDSRVVGYPFAATGLRLQVVPLSGAGGELRAWGGVDRLWAKRITVPHLGLSALLGRHRVRTLLEVDSWWYRVPRHQITENYQDAVLISRQDLVTRVHERTIVLRAGAAIPLGGGR